MRPLTLLSAAAALAIAAWWHLPAVAQRAAQPAASEAITFEQYRDFRLHDLTQRQAHLTRQLAAPDLSAVERGSLERRKAYYDQLAAMPAAKRDQLYRERFDQIDADHDGKLDLEERAVWREKQRQFYRQQAAERPGAVNQLQH
jgi:small-conductance mechanosensitive channel